MRARAGTAAVLAAVLVGGGTAASVAVPASPPGLSASATTSPSDTTGTGSATVTLITGDRVTLTQSEGHPQLVGIERGAGREGVGFLQQIENDRLYVIPTDVADLVPDRLDRALFDVAGLADAGYEESHPGTVPVIVQASASGEAAAKGAQAASSEPDWAGLGIEPERELESVGAVATDLDDDAAADLLAALQAPASSSRAAIASASDLKVWLDAPVRAFDIDSTPQIGAPQAWDAGYTGEGVTVAVLDTGVDTTHPDLDDVLVGSQDFTGTGSTTDGFGHGTHVASIALGSGDASDGVNKGVAPGADLLVGKVLGDDGSGETSWVIDGMEWAASQGADIVNLSLGQYGNYSDGTDPASLAVDALSAEFGALFVISAGNDGGAGNGTVTAPGSADSALTVGAVDDADEVTWFSSRGPRGGDYALKPDVTAPGDAIVAARAAGTAMGTVVDDQHVAASGTSMAAPHVAGAAAVLKQARPDLTGQELKAILMGSAQSTSGTVWDEGTGRIYLPTALEQQVVASPSSLSFGVFAYPQTGSETRTLTYENPTDAEVILDLALDATGPDGEPLPVGALALSAASVTVPAQGAATVDVTVDRTTGDTGRLSGAVVATAPGGGETRTTLGWSKESEHYDLTVEGIGRDGERHNGGSLVNVMNVDDGTLYSEFVELADGTWTGRVPVGTYSVAGKLWDEDAEGAIIQLTDVLEPQIEVTGNTTVVLDATAGQPVSVTTERPADRDQINLDVYRGDEPETWISGFGATIPGGADVYVTQTDPVTEGSFGFATGFTLAAPTTADEAPAYTYDLMYYREEAVETLAFAATSENTTAVAVGYADLGPGVDVSSSRFGVLAGKEWVFWPGYSRPVTPGASRTEYVTANDVIWLNTASLSVRDGSDSASINGIDQVYPLGEATDTLGGAVISTRLTEHNLIATWGDLLRLSLGAFTDSDGHHISSFENPEKLRVWQDGTEAAEEDVFFGVPIPADGADYRVVLDGERTASWWNRSTRVSTEWSFHAEPGDAGDDPPLVELPVLDVAYDIDGMDLANQAPARTTATLTVGHQVGSTGGTVARTSLWWSPDDGATWHRAALHRTGSGVYTADLRVPASTEHVSLRVEAKDKAGTTIKQTVIRAYGVR